MKYIDSLFALTLAVLLSSKVAQANCNSSSPCLGHTNFGSGSGLSGIGDTIGTGVYGQTEDGIGVMGIATGANGVAAWFEADRSTNTALVVKNMSHATAAWFEGDVYHNGTLVSSSDARLKRDVRDLRRGLQEVLKLRPVTFKWKRGDEKKAHLGLIAQEVQKVLPELVATAKEPKGPEIMTVTYLELLPVMIKAVQEQNEIIARQEARITSLEKARAETRMSSLLGGGALLGLVPLGLLVRFRRRGNKSAITDVT